jgi:hypothetical protein
MKAPARSQIVSSFTLIKGAMIEETYSVLTGWDFALSNRLDPGRLDDRDHFSASAFTRPPSAAGVCRSRGKISNPSSINRERMSDWQYLPVRPCA